MITDDHGSSLIASLISLMTAVDHGSSLIASLIRYVLERMLMASDDLPDNL